MKLLEKALGIGIWTALVGLIGTIIGYFFGFGAAAYSAIHESDFWRAITKSLKEAGL